MGSYRVITVAHGKILEGTQITEFALASGDKVPAIVLEARKQTRDILPVHYTLYRDTTLNRLYYASIMQNELGVTKLTVDTSATNVEQIICVFRTPSTYNGSNEHTGDRIGWKCHWNKCNATSTELNTPTLCPKCGHPSVLPQFAKFPGQILASIEDIQSNQQIVALMPINTVFRTSYFRRTHYEPSSYYYKWDGNRLLAATWKERLITGLF